MLGAARYQNLYEEAYFTQGCQDKDSLTRLILASWLWTVMHKHDWCKAYCLPHFDTETCLEEDPLKEDRCLAFGWSLQWVRWKAILQSHVTLAVPQWLNSLRHSSPEFSVLHPTLKQGAYKKTKKNMKKKRKKKILETCLARVNVTQFGSQGAAGSVWHLTTPARQKGKMEGWFTVNGGEGMGLRLGGRKEADRGPNRQAGRMDLIGWLVGWMLVSVEELMLALAHRAQIKARICLASLVF